MNVAIACCSCEWNEVVNVAAMEQVTLKHRSELHPGEKSTNFQIQTSLQMSKFKKAP